MTGRAHLAARDNAEWCHRVCRAHGVEGTFADDVWAAARRTPPAFPDAVTLAPGVPAEAVLARIDTTGPGSSVKDSFTDLDLAPHGYAVLFDAEWITREPGATSPSALGWERVRDAAGLAAWEAAWRGDDAGVGAAALFRAGLLEDPAVVMLGAYRGPTLVGGAVVSVGPSVVGVSNVFARPDTLDEVWSGCIAAAGQHAPGRPLVGYEHGSDLAAARRHGFAPVGALRAWAAA